MRSTLEALLVSTIVMAASLAGSSATAQQPAVSGAEGQSPAAPAAPSAPVVPVSPGATVEPSPTAAPDATPTSAAATSPTPPAADAADAALAERDAVIRELGRREGYAYALRQAARRANEQTNLAGSGGATRVDLGPRPSPVVPRDERVTVAVIHDILLRTDAGYDAYVDEDTDVTQRTGLDVGYVLLRAPEGLALSGELSWSAEVLDATVAGEFRNQLTSHAFALGAKAQQPVAPWLRARAQLDLGLEYSLMSLEQPIGPRLEGETLDFFARGGLGAGLRSPAGYFKSIGGSFGVGLAVDVGYVLSSRLNVLLAPSEPENDDEAADRIPVHSGNLGSLARSAPYARVTAELFF